MFLQHKCSGFGAATHDVRKNGLSENIFSKRNDTIKMGFSAERHLVARMFVSSSLKTGLKICDDVENLQKIKVQEFEADSKMDKKNVQK